MTKQQSTSSLGPQRASGPDLPTLLLDTCGERASVALVSGGPTVVETTLEERTATAELVPVISQMLASSGLRLRDVHGIGIVNGPGSFTGLRTGLAVAKGLCEAANLPLVGVSRLAVLAQVAGLRDGFAVLRADRQQVYVLEVESDAAAHETMLPIDVLRKRVAHREVVCTEANLEEMIRDFPRLRRVAITASSAAALVQEAFAMGSAEIALLDPSYVRQESAIYTQRGGAS